MKMTIQQLEQQLTKNLAPIYLISSDELLLVQETAESIRLHARKMGFSERTLISADSTSEWAKTLYSNAHSISLFASKQIIELNMHHAKFNSNTTKALQEYVEKPQEDTLLIIRTNKIDSKTEKSVWFQKLEKKCIFLPLWPISMMQLPQWISQRGKKLGIALTKDAAECIANQVEGNLLAAAQEIEKLALLQSGKMLDKETVLSSLSDNARFSVFDLVESVVTGNNNRSLRILRNLKEEDTEPTLILWALSREFRMLADMFTQVKQGTPLPSLFTKYRIFEKRQSSVRQFLQKQSLEKCWNLLLKAAQVDRIIKGAELGNVWDELERLAVMSVQ